MLISGRRKHQTKTKKMDYSKFYRSDEKGAYSLIFPNKFALSKPEIHEIFTEFGEVLSITTTGDERGIRFIKYQSINEAIKAIEGLQNHAKIRLVPHKVKLKTHTNGYRSEADRNKSVNGEKNNFFQRKVKEVSEGVADIDELPDLVTKSNKVTLSDCRMEGKKTILNAEEVVVANLPPRHGAGFVLHLFQDFDPIAVSSVQRIGEGENFYCYVYFQTTQEAMAVEELFDKQELMGHKLIVLRPSRLMEEMIRKF